MKVHLKKHLRCRISIQKQRRPPNKYDTMKIATLIFTFVNFLIVGFAVSAFAHIQISVNQAREEIQEIKADVLNGELEGGKLEQIRKQGVPFGNLKIIGALQENLKIE